jgi:hypothetical protein
METKVRGRMAQLEDQTVLLSPEQQSHCDYAQEQPSHVGALPNSIMFVAQDLKDIEPE